MMKSYHNYNMLVTSKGNTLFKK